MPSAEEAHRSRPTEAMNTFLRYSWPGNVRELQNFIERAVILSPGRILRPPLTELEQHGHISDSPEQSLAPRPLP